MPITYGSGSELSQPIPSPSVSNPCGSGGKTLKSSETSEQFRSGGGDFIQKSG
ncbi:MAG TPA: hypothetical protein VHH33_03630 [Nitrososphaeraceae archaeon]|jgi:hypothetical protein|nr:hypothetical protein [Nitrososphaeraceae archaeon]